jgi:hypothetical protein
MLLTKLRLRQRGRWLRGLGRCAPCRPCLLPARYAGSSALGRRFAPPCRAREGGLGRCAPCRPPWARLAERGHPLRGQRCGHRWPCSTAAHHFVTPSGWPRFAPAGRGAAPRPFFSRDSLRSRMREKKAGSPRGFAPKKKRARLATLAAAPAFFRLPQQAAACTGASPPHRPKTGRLAALADARFWVEAAPRLRPHCKKIASNFLAWAPACALSKIHACALRLPYSLRSWAAGLAGFFRARTQKALSLPLTLRYNGNINREAGKWK